MLSGMDTTRPVLLMGPNLWAMLKSSSHASFPKLMRMRVSNLSLVECRCYRVLVQPRLVKSTMRCTKKGVLHQWHTTKSGGREGKTCIGSELCERKKETICGRKEVEHPTSYNIGYGACSLITSLDSCGSRGATLSGQSVGDNKQKN